MKVRTALVPRSLLVLPFLTICLLVPEPLASSGAVENGKPSVSLRASPNVGFAPVRMVLTAEVKGGPNDFEDFYCAAVEWDITAVNGIGGNMKAEQQAECDPYEAGKSEIRRRFVREQVFRSSGEYRVQFNLKQKNKIVGSARTTVRVREGVGDPGIHSGIR